ncbi:MAG: carbonic anhydrase family protein [Hylemonella sp.]|nr:carbonic anhydrase family protein [Hylemonella sp.]
MKPIASPLPTARLTLLALLLAGGIASVRAADSAAAPAAPTPVPAVAPPRAPAASAPASAPARVEGTRTDIESQLRDAMSRGDPKTKRLNLIVDGKSSSAGLAATPGAAPPVNPVDSKPPAVAGPRPREPGLVIRQQRPGAAAAAPAAHKDIHWSYEGEGAPTNWGKLKPDYATCASGQRQSPIHIEDSETLRGPAEAIEFRYAPSKGTVVNNGHTVEVKVYGENSLTVRGNTYQLVQFHFHHPAEERINGQGYPMVGHFVHRNEQGQLAVLAVLLEPGEANPLIQKVWTHMPLDVNDSVRLPPDLIHVGEILPRDQRYYQYMGSLTTPPCTEGVLWLILKQPVSISREQLRLFGQLYANNARPVQPRHDRPVRDAVLIAPGGRP